MEKGAEGPMKPRATGRRSKSEDEVGDKLNEAALDGFYLGVRKLMLPIYSGGRPQS